MLNRFQDVAFPNKCHTKVWIHSALVSVFNNSLEVLVRAPQVQQGRAGSSPRATPARSRDAQGSPRHWAPPHGMGSILCPEQSEESPDRSSPLGQGAPGEAEQGWARLTVSHGLNGFVQPL